MFVAGAPAGGYCAATCARCPLGSTPAPAAAAAPSPSVTLPTAPAPAPAVPACVDTAPNDDFSCAELVRIQCGCGLFTYEQCTAQPIAW